VARLLIVGGGCRGRLLAAELVTDGHAVRIVSRSESRREPIESVGAQCVIADPDRLGTLRPALEAVTVACWLLATARGPREQVDALHGSRLERFVHQLIDTTVRGFVYEAPSLASGSAAVSSEKVVRGGEVLDAVGEGVDSGGEGVDAVAADHEGVDRLVAPAVLVEGRQIASTLARRNAIPLSVLSADPSDRAAWLSEARAAVAALLGAGPEHSGASLRATA
jgi:hypothetical protein